MKPSDLRQKKPAASKINRSDFIRQHPNLSPNDVVELGKKNGLVFSRNLVYLVRGPRSSESPAPARAAKAAAPAARPAQAAPRSPGGASTEHELARLLLTVGLDRGEQILRQLRSALSA